jgi:hypothetical protein
VEKNELSRNPRGEAQPTQGCGDDVDNDDDDHSYDNRQQDERNKDGKLVL